MQNGELFISSRDGVYRIRVIGRATFECAPALRNMASTLEQETFRQVRIDLSGCTWMDSTFMGILAMIGLRAKKINAEAFIVNADAQNENLLCGLGLRKVFQFTTEKNEPDAPAPAEAPKSSSSSAQDSALDSAKTVLAAHETLMDVDEENVRKFRNVVSMVRQEIQKKEGQDGNPSGDR